MWAQFVRMWCALLVEPCAHRMMRHSLAAQLDERSNRACLVAQGADARWCAACTGVLLAERWLRPWPTCTNGPVRGSARTCEPGWASAVQMIASRPPDGLSSRRVCGRRATPRAALFSEASLDLGAAASDRGGESRPAPPLAATPPEPLEPWLLERVIGARVVGALEVRVCVRGSRSSGCPGR